MKIRLIYLTIALLSLGFTFSQQKSVKLLGETEDPILNPLLSPDGKYVAFSKSNYRGIYVLKLDDNSIKELTDEVAAGFGMQWSLDSKFILSRPAYYDGLIRYNTIKIYNIETKEVSQLTDYRTRMPSLPYWSSFNDEVVFAHKGNVERFQSNIQIQSSLKTTDKNISVFLMDDKIAVRDNSSGQLNILEPVTGKKCMNLSVSPDYQRVVFEIYGGDLYSMKIDGTELYNLGKGYRGKWLKDSETIVYMISEDDGHQFTSSDIFTIRYDGTNKKNITSTPDKLEMSPSASLVDNTIVFEVLDEGSIHLMKLEE
jgi:Tol biopolymer transport system component